ncbi:hypothetical protein [Peribacillus glennii]|uniref:hypothetical protein n=1 Tax=Peribacillus glennii TaxID=2303991 RepID=UPI0013148561|nr:hypothetical protein [Peribacillus glennii]
MEKEILKKAREMDRDVEYECNKRSKFSHESLVSPEGSGGGNADENPTSADAK